jgi:hypothetical protein
VSEGQGQCGGHHGGVAEDAPAAGGRQERAEGSTKEKAGEKERGLGEGAQLADGAGPISHDPTRAQSNNRVRIGLVGLTQSAERLTWRKGQR